MADIRCPMCGKPNPAELDVCQFCQARLKPVWAAPTPEETAPLPPEVPSEKPSEPEQALPDWLQSLRQPEAEVPTPEEEAVIPEWLAESQAQTAELKGEGGETEALPSEDLDWLARISAPQVQEPEEQPPELPDWLSDIEAIPPEDQAEALPDWLKFEEQAPEPEAKMGEEEAELPEWLLSSEEELPDWLRNQVAEAQAPPVESELPTPPVEAELDWLVGEGIGAQEQVPEEKPVGVPAFEMEQEVGIEQQVPPLAELGEPETEEYEELYSEELPAWLTSLEPEPPSVQEEAQEIAPSLEEEPELAPAELPSWLEAMRPLPPFPEPIGLPEGEAVQVEGAGPLAGLKGVLPAEPEIYHTRKPPIYSIKLQVSDLQKSHADLLAQMVSKEGEAQPIPAQPIISPQHIFRISIALFLILTLLFTLFTGEPKVDLPVFNIIEARGLQEMIENLPARAPVLLAVDYQPGLSAEMEIVTGAVLRHLASREAFIVFVSTSPIGPLQAEHLVAYVRPEAQATQYVNLGFIPSGAPGLLALVNTPRQILPYDTSGNPAWERPVLQNIQTLADFSMVIVATEDLEVARVWVEQAKPNLGSTPLVLLCSAQVEPLLRPYYQAYPSQIQGLLSGLAGGAAYRELLGQSERVNSYWSAFSMGGLVALVLIALGGITNAVMALLVRREQKKAERRT